MKRGFTLIELLAVIVILAIIALIATPIVINIIDDSKKSATLRSADFYLDALEMSIANSTLKEQKIKDGTYNILESGNICLSYDANNNCTEELEVEVNGEVPKEGTIAITNCNISDVSIVLNEKAIVKNSEGELVYQEIPKQVYKPKYYSFSSGSIDGNLPSDIKENPSELNTKGFPFYFGLDVDSNNKVSAAYLCFTLNEVEYCLKGDDAKAYETNKKILETAFNEVKNACSFGIEKTSCTIDGLNIYLNSTGESYGDDNYKIAYIEYGYFGFVG